MSNDINMGKTGVERLRESRERKKQKKRENNARFYAKNKEKILEKRKEQRRSKRTCVTVTVTEQSKSRVPKPNWRLYKTSQRARKRAEKEKTTSKSDPVPPIATREEFSNGTVPQRAIDVTEVSLPLNPRRNVPSKANL